MKLNITCIYLIVCVFSLTIKRSEAQTASLKNNQKPNIIVILADDLAYGDLSCFGNTMVKTPNLDRLAANGMLFTDFHSNSSVCSPTRAALLTGRYQQRTGVLNVSPKSILRKEETLIASRLKEKGYATGLFGKWHLSGHYNEPDFYSTYGPNKFGFDEFIGCMDGMIDHANHLTPRGRPDWWKNDQLFEEKGYDTHLIANHTIDFINKNKNTPFFAYVAFTAIHFPWTRPKDPGHYKWYTDHTKAGNPATSKAGPYDGSKEIQSVLFEMLADMDEQIGEIMAQVKKLGLEDNTFVFFTSDNGGYRNYYNDGTKNHNMSNLGGLRGQKHDLYEGGHRVPAIAYMPNTIPKGVVSKETTMTFDLYPTILEMVGLSAKKNPKPIDGASMWSILKQNNGIDSKISERMLFWEYDGDLAVRYKNWKLFKKRKKDSPFELYDLNNDLAEKNNQADQNPDIVLKLKRELKKWLVDVDLTNRINW